jgi:hypothetical protein
MQMQITMRAVSGGAASEVGGQRKKMIVEYDHDQNTAYEHENRKQNFLRQFFIFISIN